MNDDHLALFQLAENVLLTLTSDRDTLTAICAHLHEVNWEQRLLARAQSQREAGWDRYTEAQAILQAGGGFCDQCHRLVEKRRFWPYVIKSQHSYSVDPTPMEWLYCSGCYDRAQRTLLKTFPREYRPFVECQGCQRVLPENRAYFISDAFYCLFCVERATEKQFVLCEGCGKKTANFQHPGARICRECDQRYPYQSHISIHLARAREAGTPATLTLREWVETLEYFHYRCAYCRARPYTVLEHFQPISLGGGTTVENCVPACHSCNSTKSNTPADRLSSLFPRAILEHIQQYLTGEKFSRNPYPATTTALVVYQPGER